MKWKGVGERALPPGGDILVIVAHDAGKFLLDLIAKIDAEE